MASDDLATAIAGSLEGISKGSYLLLVEAIRQLGGEMRVDPRAYAQASVSPLFLLEVDGTDGAIVIRLREPRAAPQDQA